MEWPDPIYATLKRRSARFRHVDHNPGDRALRRFLPRLLAPGIRVLDVGCGEGVGVCHLAASGASDVVYVGVDPDTDAAATAAATLASQPTGSVTGGIAVTTIQDHLETAPEPVHLLLWCRALHECVDQERWEESLALVRRVTSLVRPGGHVVVSEPVTPPEASPEERARIAGYRGTIAPGGRPHLSARQVDELVGPGLVEIHRDETPSFVLGAYHGLSSARTLLVAWRQPE